MTTDSEAEPAGGTAAKPEPKPGRSPSASACEAYGDTIEVGLCRGRNAKVAAPNDVLEDYSGYVPIHA